MLSCQVVAVLYMQRIASFDVLDEQKRLGGVMGRVAKMQLAEAEM